jgi:hypothetical protein
MHYTAPVQKISIGMKRKTEVTIPNHDLAIRFEERLLARQKLDAHEKDLSDFFEFIATSLFADFPSRKGHYFDGAVGLAATAKNVRQVEFQGEMWVGGNQDQWTEPFQATVTNKRITKEGIWIVVQVGADRAEGEIMSICCGRRA